MSSSLLLQLCPACLVRLTCIVFVMGGKWPYSWCLVGCCRQDLFNLYSNGISTFIGYCCTLYIMDSPSSINTHQESVRGVGQTPVFGVPCHLFEAHFGRLFWSVQLGQTQHWRFPPASGGHPHRLLPPYGGLGLLPGTWGTPNKGNADGAEGIFGNGGRMWTHLKNGLVPNLLIRWGTW